MAPRSHFTSPSTAIDLTPNPSLQQLMRFLTDETNLGAIRAAGFSPATSAAYNLNTDVLTNADAVLAASDGASAFAVPADLSGPVNIVGAASAHRVLARTGDRLTQQNARLELSYLYGGAAAGINSLCSGEADIAVLDAELMSADLDACATNEMVTLSLDIGTQATVLVAHAAEAAYGLFDDRPNQQRVAGRFSRNY